MDEKRFRLDFVIAFFALLISTVAAIAAIYQTRVIAQQFSATVWPYVSMDVTNSPVSFELDLRNDGLGPAIVRSVSITWDGKPQPSIEALYRSFVKHDPKVIAPILAAKRAGQTVRITTSTPTSGLVIPANSAQVILRLEGSTVVQVFRPRVARVGLSLCYCSLTGSCWTQSFQNRESEPRAVSSCPIKR